jgi:hypothetical protein
MVLCVVLRLILPCLALAFSLLLVHLVYFFRAKIVRWLTIRGAFVLIFVPLWLFPLLNSVRVSGVSPIR